MATKRLKPDTPSRRFNVVPTFDEITKIFTLYILMDLAEKDLWKIFSKNKYRAMKI